MQDGTLKGILWHQGESDSVQAPSAATYALRLDQMIADMRKDLGSKDLPFVCAKLGIVELSAIWVPMYLMMLDGGYEFTNRLNGRPVYPLTDRPSDYFRRHVRVSSFAYELPARLIRDTGDLYMCCSDYPHSEGTATPIDDYEGSARPVRPADAPGLFGANANFLLGRS